MPLSVLFVQENDRKRLRVGMWCVALYEEDELYYRAKIVSFKDRNYVEVNEEVTL